VPAQPVARRPGRASWHGKDELDKAIADYDAAIRLDPKYVLAINNRGAALHDKGELDKAIADYDEAIRLDSTNVQAHNNRGGTLCQRGDFDKAIADFDEAIRLDPKYSNAFANRAAAWDAKGELDKALADYAEAIRLDPRNVWALIKRGDTWYRKGDFKEALADYDKAIDIDPKSMEAHGARAWLRATCPDEAYRGGAKSVEDATKASELADRKDSDMLDTLAAAYAESGQFDKAVESQEKAIELAPEDEKEEYRSRLKLYQEGKPYRVRPKN